MDTFATRFVATEIDRRVRTVAAATNDYDISTQNVSFAIDDFKPDSTR